TVESGSQNANDTEGMAVEAKRSRGQVVGAAEPVAPHAVAHHGNRLGPVIGDRERDLAPTRVHAEEAEITVRDELTDAAFAEAASAEAEHDLLARLQVAQRRGSRAQGSKHGVRDEGRALRRP